jgi:hypothetical protein
MWSTNFFQIIFWHHFETQFNLLFKFNLFIYYMY